ncbi:MAG: imidazolonepropionase [Arenicellaceae bacterium]|nr:imidazolonepropionase [Arenicellaceae bacterium]
MQREVLYTECRVATMHSGKPEYGLIENGAIVVRNGRIAWVGDAQGLPAQYSNYSNESLGQRLITPALIDCHTHLVFGGNRASEFEMRLNGASYEEISKAGSGIVSTVRATRLASDKELLQSAITRLDDLISEGVAVVEIKSGYGLTIADEIRMLRVARKLESLRPVKILTTWLAAHALPVEYEDKPDDYINEVAILGLQQAAEEGLVDAVDGFCETIGFSPAQIERLFEVAHSLGLPVKLHAEQLSDQKGALLVGKYAGLSADHLEYLSVDDVPKFAESGAVAVMLPGAFYTLRESKIPPINVFRSTGVEMAIATDCNPGSSPISSILTAMNIACTQFSMTPEEALAGTTRCAAQALGLQGDYGVIEDGALAELAVWNVQHPAELSYWVGPSKFHKRISHGETS